MASITLDRITVDFPIYNAARRSLKSELFRRTAGCKGGWLKVRTQDLCFS